MKIFLSYGHDSNAPLIVKIKDYLSKDAEGNLKHKDWMDKSEIKAGKDWREKGKVDDISHEHLATCRTAQRYEEYYHFEEI